MNLRLAYRIASMKPMVPHAGMLPVPAREKDLVAWAQAEAVLIARVPSFNFDNVAEFYAAHDRQLWDPEEDIPNFAPPFGSFWVEWNEPRVWNITDGSQPEGAGQVGFFCRALEITDDTRSNIPYWEQAISRLVGIKRAADHSGEWDLPLGLRSARWLLACSSWFSKSEAPFRGAPFWTALTIFVFVSAEGRCVHRFAVGLTARCFDARPEAIWSPFHILGLGLSFCHCKNVRRVEAEVDAGERFHRREKVPRIKFYTLEINPMREVLRREGQAERVGLVRALHICRGHFATYTPEHPLFGKYVGTFWRPDHVRGSREAGEVNKNYSVGSPNSG